MFVLWTATWIPFPQTALAMSGFPPSAVDYVEAHGTGTRLGDAVELAALSNVLGRDRPADRPLLVGSVKTNIGHLEAGAGVASLIKVVLALQHGEVPPHLHFRTPSPYIPWDDIPWNQALDEISRWSRRRARPPFWKRMPAAAP